MSAKIHVVTSTPHQSPQKCKKICTNTTSAFRFFFFFNRIFYFFNFFFFYKHIGQYFRYPRHENSVPYSC